MDPDTEDAALAQQQLEEQEIQENDHDIRKSST